MRMSGTWSKLLRLGTLPDVIFNTTLPFHSSFELEEFPITCWSIRWEHCPVNTDVASSTLFFTYNSMGFPMLLCYEKMVDKLMSNISSDNALDSATFAWACLFGLQESFISTVVVIALELLCTLIVSLLERFPRMLHLFLLCYDLHHISPCSWYLASNPFVRLCCLLQFSAGLWVFQCSSPCACTWDSFWSPSTWM